MALLVKKKKDLTDEERAQRNPKNRSSGFCPSSKALLKHTMKSESSRDDVRKLYFQSTHGGDFAQYMNSRSPKEESAGEVYGIGHKTTKNLPFRYRQASSHDMGSFYTQDYGLPKSSDAPLNKTLNKIFSRQHVTSVGAPSLTPGNYALDFVRHPKTLLGPDGEVRKVGHGGKGGEKPEIARTFIVSASSASHETQSFSHSTQTATGLRLQTDSCKPRDNLALTGIDSGDCYRSTYGSHFKSPSRCSSAPAGMTRKEANELKQYKEMAAAAERPSTGTGQRPSRQPTPIRNIFSRN